MEKEAKKQPTNSTHHTNDEHIKNIDVSHMISELGLSAVVIGDLHRYINTTNIYQIGYELLGYFLDENTEFVNSVNICGNKEFQFLCRMPHDKKIEFFEKYFAYAIPILIITSGNMFDEEILDIARAHNITILQSDQRTPEIIRRVKFYLLHHLVVETTLRGYVLMDVFGVGILIEGYENAKQGVMVELLRRGHRLISDDHIVVRRLGEGILEGCNPTDTSVCDSHFFISNKANLPLIDVTTEYGIKGTRARKYIEMIITFELWNDKKFYDRLGIKEMYREILGEKVPRLEIPVRRGRNLAIIIETAAINHKAKSHGINSAQYFVEESKKIIRKKMENPEIFKKYNTDPVAVIDLKNRFDLTILHGEDKIKNTYVMSTTLHRPALALSGYTDTYDDSNAICIQIFSDFEFDYLESLDEPTRMKNLQKYLSYPFPMLILTRDVKVPEYFIDLIRRFDLILARSTYKRSSQLIANFNRYLETRYGQNISMHGVFVEIYGFGVLITGKSGIGKSETALELINYGHRLVADDMVTFVKDTSGDIIGRASKLPYFMEIRGLGIIDIKSLYGISTVRESKRLDLIVDLRETESVEYTSAMDDHKSTQEVLGVEFPSVTLYISSGRNAAALIEIAVMNLMAKALGHDSQRDYNMQLVNSRKSK